MEAKKETVTDEFSSYSTYSSTSDEPTPGAPVIRRTEENVDIIGKIVGTFILEDNSIYHVSQKTLDKNERNAARMQRNEIRSKRIEKRIADYEEHARLIKRKAELQAQVAEIDDQIEIVNQRLRTNVDGTIPVDEVKRRLKRKFC